MDDETRQLEIDAAESERADWLYEEWLEEQIMAEREAVMQQIIWECVHPSFVDDDDLGSVLF